MLQRMPRARQADRAKDNFLAALSHELRTPLTPVLLTASDGAADPAVPAQCREAFAAISKSITLEARLIDDLLDLNRVTRGKLKLDRGLVDVSAVLSDAIANVRPDFSQKQITLVVAGQVPHAVVSGDATRLQQVFWNVLRNAAKFTPAGGTVTVSARCEPQRFTIEVTDTGIGMTA